VAAARSAIASKQAALDAQQSIIEAARATIAVDRATQTFAEQDDKRFAHLASTGYGSMQN
jgi:membrane fusion protein (multidrug efflux system)